MQQSMNKKPTAFICSSREGLAIAECIQAGMSEEVDVTLWTQGAFPMSKATIEGLESAKDQYDFAILVLTPDDIRETRGRRGSGPRDNVVLELGFFVGALGRERTFAVRHESVSLPSDFDGITVAKFSTRPDGNLRAALGPACTTLKECIRRRPRILDGGIPTCPGPQNVVARRRRRRSLGCAVMSASKFHIVDISVTGALLETDGELPVGQDLDLSLELEDGNTVNVTARIVRVQRPEWKRVGGVGVAFTHYSDGSRELLEQYVSADCVVVQSN